MNQAWAAVAGDQSDRGSSDDKKCFLCLIPIEYSVRLLTLEAHVHCTHWGHASVIGPGTHEGEWETQKEKSFLEQPSYKSSQGLLQPTRRHL